MAKKRKLLEKRFGPFVCLDGSHTEIDPILTAEINKVGREAWRAPPGSVFQSENPNDVNTLVREDEQHNPGPGEVKDLVVERIYRRGDPPFMSTMDLDQRFNVRTPDGKGYKYPPKFQRSADAATGLGINPEEMRRPGESLRDYAERMAKLAEAEGEQAPPAAQPKPQGTAKR